MNRKGNVYVTRLLPRLVMEKLGEVCDFEANTEPRPATREEPAGLQLALRCLAHIQFA